VEVLIAIVGVNVLVSLIGFPRLAGGPGPRADAFLFIPYQVARGRNGLGLLLGHFSHAGWPHLVFNMIALASFAGTVIGRLGAARFLLIYVAAGLGSDLVVFALRRDDPTYRCLGASGSVFGIMMAAVVVDPTTSIVLLVAPVPIPGPFFMLGYAVISIVLIAQNRRGGISHEGHLGGALIGLAVTALLAPRGLAPLIRWLAQWV